MGRPKLHALLLAAWLAAAAVLLARGAAAKTFPGDKLALLAFRDGLTESSSLLEGWSEDTDPCGDRWTGIKCDCKDFFYSVENSMVCSPPPALPNNITRVLQINFGDPRITQRSTLKGTISPSLGNLTELRVLNLNYNNLYGSLPYTLRQATSLEQLLVGNNRLTGTLPAYLGSMQDLRYVWLNDNFFMGQVPDQWCAGAWWQFRVDGNAGLCNELPPCLHDRILSYEGTSIIDTVDNQDDKMGGYCGVVPPICMPDRGCKFLSPEPPFWTNATFVTFSFSDFDSPSNSGAMQYRWAIGSTRWGRDVLDWKPFEGFTSMQPVQGATSWVNRTVFYVDHRLQQVMLKQGQQYYVVVQGINDAGVHMGTMLSSHPITVDWTPPDLPPGGTVYSGEHFVSEPFQTETGSMAASWDEFVDEETGVDYYSYQVFEFEYKGEGNPGYVGRALTGKIKLGKDRSVYIINLQLAQGNSYFVRVYATNGAGLEGYRDASPVRIVTGSSSSGVAVSKVVVLVAVMVGATSACVAVITVYIVRERFRRRQVAKKQLRGQMKNFKYLMTGLTKQLGDPACRDIEGLRSVKELAFVITDLENSTTIASSCPKSFDKVQEMHDNLLRELIQRHGGYEINTEGDAFHVAFTDVHSAVQFCLDVQYQMMDQEWPGDVMRLAQCKEVKGPDGSLMFRGPRIRMGLHWAVEGTVAQRLHQLTKHRIFTGPAFQVTRDLCEAAHGGQVLISHDAWVRLRQDMAAASFPVVEQLGLYKARGWLAPLWVYQVTHHLGRPLHRHLGPVRDLMQVEGGWGLCIMPPPLPRSSKNLLTFVSARMALECCTASVVNSAMGRRLYELLAMVAQQFQGYIFRLSESQGCYLLVFSSCVDAVRFCHAGQTLLMYSHWPAELQDYMGPTEVTADNRLVYKGPRLAMAVHESDEYSCMTVSRKQAAAEELAMDYVGPAEEFVKLLSEVTQGGQVVLSESAWASVQDQLPGQAQVISLGTHVLDEVAFPQPMMVMEVMPSVLAKRSFPPPLTARMVETGYRDAPEVDNDMTIVFVKVSKPAEVKEAEQAKDGVSDDIMIRFITAYNVGLNKAVKLMRQLLSDFAGYECKEPEAGKITVAFRALEDAIQWGCAVQKALLTVPWPDPVLTWEECSEASDPVTGELLWRGLRVCMGMAFGLPTSKAPLNTGRADYFGALPNLAARLMSLAQPGQVLVHGNLNSMAELQWTTEDHSAAVLPGPAGMVELSQLGYFSVKGIEGGRLVYQASLKELAGRHFQPHPDALRLNSGGSTLSRLLSIRMRGSDAGSDHSPRHFGGVRTPRTLASRPKVFTSISRSNSMGNLTARANRPRTPRQAGGGGRAGGTGVEASGISCISLSCISCAGDDDEEARVAMPAGARMGEEGRHRLESPDRHASSSGGWLAGVASRLKSRMGSPTREGASDVDGSQLGDALSEMHPMASRTGSVAQSTGLPHSRASSFSMPHLGMGAMGGGPVLQEVQVVDASSPPHGSRQGSPRSKVALQFEQQQRSKPPSPLGLKKGRGGGQHELGPRSPTRSPTRSSPTRYSLRDVADWSYPASTLGTPTSHRSGALSEWDDSLSLELQLRQGMAMSGSSPKLRRPQGPNRAIFDAPSRTDSMLSVSTLGAGSMTLPRGVQVLSEHAGHAADGGPGGAGAEAAEGAGEGAGASMPPRVPPIKLTAFAAPLGPGGGHSGGGQPSQPGTGLAARRPHMQLEISEPTPESSTLDILTPGFLYARQIAQLFVEGRRRTAEASSRTSWLPMPSRFRGDSALAAAQEQGEGSGGGSGGRRRLSPRKSPKPSPRGWQHPQQHE